MCEDTTFGISGASTFVHDKRDIFFLWYTFFEDVRLGQWHEARQWTLRDGITDGVKVFEQLCLGFIIIKS